MSPQPPWKRSEGGEPEPAAGPPGPQEPAPPETQLPPPAAPATQLPPPGGGPSGGTPPPRRTGLLLGGVAAVIAVAVVVVVLLAGGDDEPGPERAVASSTPAAETAEPTAAVTAQPTALPDSLRDLLAEEVGPYRLASVRRGDVLIDEEGADEAFGVDYEGPGGESITHNVGLLASPERADAVRRGLIRSRKRYGARVVVEQPYVIDGAEVGTLTVLHESTWVAAWTNGSLYSTALAGSEGKLKTFVDAMPY